MNMFLEFLRGLFESSETNLVPLEAPEEAPEEAAEEVEEVINIPELNYTRLIDKNKSWSRRLMWNSVQVSNWLEIPIEEEIDEDLVDAVYLWQKRSGLTPDGIIGPNTLEKMLKVFLSDRDYQVRKVVMPTIIHESRGRFDSVNIDGEFRGKFNKTWQRRYGKDHPAYNKVHISLSIGLLQATVDGGAAGKMLKKFRVKNQDLFDSIIGSTAEQLIEITNRKGKSGLSTGKLRGPRVQPVPIDLDGDIRDMDLWEDEWVARIKRVLREPEFMDMQIEFFVDDYLKPNLGFMRLNSLTSEKAISACFDRAIHKGGGGFRKWARNALDGKEKSPQMEKIRILKVADPTGRFKKRILDDTLTYNDWKGYKYF